MAVCTHCGFDITPDTPLAIGDFSMGGADFPLCYRGKPIRLSYSENAIVWALIKTSPYPLRRDVLLDRMDSDGCNNTLDVMVCKLRKKLRDVAGFDPIETIRVRGYRWLPVTCGGLPLQIEAPHAVA